MAPGQIIDVREIPFLTKDEIGGRFISSLSFYDAGKWRTWAPIENSGQKVIEILAWPAEAFYFSATGEKPADLLSYFLTFIAQRANFVAIQPKFSAVQDDIFNVSASLAKLDLIFAASDKTGGATRMAATEVEYILLVCRSLFDLLQEIIANLWSTVQLTDTSQKTKALKNTFSDMTLSDNKLRSAAEIAARWALPKVVADCYARHAPVFQKVRQFRDTLVHRGYQVQTIFRGNEGFLIRKRLGPFVNLDIWRDGEGQHDLVPLMPALAMVIHHTLAACEDFAQTLTSTIRFPDPIVPGMHLYMRGYYNDALAAALTDANQRLLEGRRLITDPA